MRELFRYRQKLIGHHSSVKNRFQNSLTVSNIALSSVLTDTFGKSATAIVGYILACDVFDPEYCKSLLLKKAKDKADDVVKSIIGYELRGDQSIKMKVCKKLFDHINECISTLEEAISDLSQPYHKFIELATTIPGNTEKSASFPIAEIGMDMAVFKSSKRLCSWAGLTPQNKESAGKKKSVHISRAGVYLKPLLVQYANAAIKDNKEALLQIQIRKPLTLLIRIIQRFLKRCTRNSRNRMIRMQSNVWRRGALQLSLLLLQPDTLHL